MKLKDDGYDVEQLLKKFRYIDSVSYTHLVSYVDGLVNESISTSFNFIDDQYAESDLPLEINVKNQIFDIMQKLSLIHI